MCQEVGRPHVPPFGFPLVRAVLCKQTLGEHGLEPCAVSPSWLLGCERLLSRFSFRQGSLRHGGICLGCCLPCFPLWSALPLHRNLKLSFFPQTLSLEAPARIKNKAPPPDWPQEGEVTFENAEMRYRENLPLVLKKVSFTIKPKEKIGIVGRTGSGKDRTGL